jgi:hypothetical protein
MGEAIVTASIAARKIIEFGLDAAMNEYNKK